jgi:hypothetical protein
LIGGMNAMEDCLFEESKLRGTKMNAAIIDELEQARRDALVAYYLGQVAPTHEVVAARSLATPEDLYEFLLIDNQVNAKVDTSDVAMAVASVQQYIHMIYNGMEPGYHGIFKKDEQKRWRQWMSEYAVWAGNQMLQDYPENYLDPTLRFNRTQAFDDFISETNQGRISKESVQAALCSYLKKFEALCNLDTVSGYIDGVDFKNADYYFIGQQREAPKHYFWRKLKVGTGTMIRNLATSDGRWEISAPATESMVLGKDERGARPNNKTSAAAQRKEATQIGISPAAWTEWEAIDIPKGDEIVAIRPFVVNGRLYVAWVEYAQGQEVPEASSNGLAIPVHRYTIQLSYREAGGTWAIPMSFPLTKDRGAPIRGEDDPEGIPDPFIAIAGVEAVDPKLVLSYGTGPDREVIVLSGAHAILYPRSDALPVDAAYPDRLASYPAEANAIQYLYTSVNNTISMTLDESEGAYANFLALELWFGLHSSGHGKYLRGSLLASFAYVDASGGTPDVTIEFGWRAKDTESYSKKSATVPLTGYLRYPLGLSYDKTDDADIYVHITSPGAIASRVSYTLHFPVIAAGDVPTLGITVEGAQYLDLRPLQIPDLSYIRLNTTFGKELVAKSETSVDALLDWTTQHMAEPALPDGAAALMDFHGTHGRYFWELFFHIPHALAWRLHHEFDYTGAEEWLHYIFNPLARIKPTQPPSPPYWSVRALMEASPVTYEFDGLADPDAICYSNPVHYRKAIFVLYVRNLIAYGDELYRRLTRDTLNEAKLAYVRATSLLGPKPDNRMIDRWQPCTLHAAAQNGLNTFVDFETHASLPQVYADAKVDGLPWLSLLDVPWVRLPVNTALLSLWDDLQMRLDNLRNNLTLDGKPLQLPLYAPPINPTDLLRAQSSGNGVVQRGVGSMASVPPYRFRALLPRVQGAIETLIRFGDQVRMHREQKERAMLEELQQSHLLELSAFTISLQESSLEQARLSEKALESSKAVIEARRDYFTEQAEGNISNAERTAMDLYLASGIIGTASAAIQTAAGAANMASTIVTAVGGGHTRAGSAFVASSTAAVIASNMTRLAGDRISINEQYRRRLQDWEFQRDQANAEIAAIEAQIEVSKRQTELSTRQLAQATRVQAQAQEHYTFLKTRSTNAGLYQWLVSQMSTLYFQAYDAVVALCLSAESAWRYEMGDENTYFVQPNGWFDNYHGLTAGEALRLQMLRMETAHLRRNERRLELTRTISLRELTNQHHQLDSRQNDWEDTLAEIRDEGGTTFELPHWLFDSDYPGHYLRQIVSVSVSLPVVVGAYQDIRAILTQVSSKTVLKADPRAMNHLYDKSDKDQANIRFNPRATQSIGLSSGVDDHGLFALDFNDERYLPFEGTGAVSTWQLTFPRADKAPQKQILDTLNDVIIHVRYTAVDGGPTFTEHVSNLVSEVVDRC